MRSWRADAARARCGLRAAVGKLQRRACEALLQGSARPERAQLLGPSPAGLCMRSSLP